MNTGKHIPEQVDTEKQELTAMREMAGQTAASGPKAAESKPQVVACIPTEFLDHPLNIKHSS
jgi:hypothetical protein